MTIQSQAFAPTRPRQELTEQSLYPRWYEVSTRYGDMDPARHVNNVAVAQLYEEGRVRFHREPPEHDPIRLVVAQLTLHYLGEISYPEPVRIGIGASHIARTSFTTCQAIVQGGVCVGLAQTTAVHVVDGTATPLPDWFRPHLEQHRLGVPVGS